MIPLYLTGRLISDLEDPLWEDARALVCNELHRISALPALPDDLLDRWSSLTRKLEARTEKVLGSRSSELAESAPSGEQEISNVRPSAELRTPAGWSWLLKQVDQSPDGLSGCPMRVQVEARRLARDVGRRALNRFDRLSAADRDEIIARALDRFCHQGLVSRGLASGEVAADPFLLAAARSPVGEGDCEAYFRHAVRCEAIALTERPFQAAPRGLEPAAIATAGDTDLSFFSWLDQARHRIHLLQGLERRVFFASAALDSIAAEHEVFKVALYTAVALRLRLDSVLKHMSRARQKLFLVKGRDALEWTDAWKYLEPPSDELAHAARVYLAACRAPGTGDAVVRWAEAHEEHEHCSDLFKEQSAVALCAWRTFVDALNAGSLKPQDVGVGLFKGCVEFGIDHRIIETRIRSGQTWSDLLLNVDIKRPTADEREAWSRLLSEHPFDAGVSERWKELEARSSQADLSQAALTQAYTRLLEAETDSPDDFIRKRDEFLRLVDAK